MTRYPRERRTPVTGLPTQELITLIGIAAASEARRGASSASRRRDQRLPVRPGARPRPRVGAAARGGLRRRRRRADPRARPARDAQPARPRDALRRHRSDGQRRAARRRRRGLDERAGVRAAQAPGRAVRRRARAPPAALRRGLGALSRSPARSSATPSSATPTSCSRGRSTSRRSTTTTWSRSATAPSASCGASSTAASRLRATPTLAPGSARLEHRRELPRGSWAARTAADVLAVQEHDPPPAARDASRCSTGHDSSSTNANTGSESAAAIDATDT